MYFATLSVLFLLSKALGEEGKSTRVISRPYQLQRVWSKPGRWFILEWSSILIQQPPISLLSFKFKFCHASMKCANIRFFLKAD